MLKTNLYDYSNAYTLVKGTITIAGAAVDATTKQADERNKEVVFKLCTIYWLHKPNK